MNLSIKHDMQVQHMYCPFTVASNFFHSIADNHKKKNPSETELNKKQYYEPVSSFNEL